MADASDDPTDSGPDGPTEQALRELLRAEHHRAEVEARRRRRELHRQAMESLSVHDVLRDLAGTGAQVVIQTRSSSVPPSIVVEVGRDHVVLRAHGRETRLVPIAAIASIQPMGAASMPLVAPSVSDDAVASLHDQLTELALRRTRVRIAGAAGTATGRMRSIGLDLLVLTQDDGTDRVIALAALDDVVF